MLWGMFGMHRFHLIAALALSIFATVGFAAPPSEPGPTEGAAIPPHVAKFGRSRPLVAVVGENTFTEVTDYVIPYGVLRESGVADVVALATQAGPIQMFPALKIRPHATVQAFDARHPEGADYVIVPAVHRTEDAVLLAWVKSQAAKGATIVGVCDGVWVLANAGLLKGRKAVGHWYSFGDLESKFSDTTWVRNRRYLAHDKVITTTGVTASIPVSLALVEAIGGHERAVSVARALGVSDWGATHRSDDFKLGARHMLTAATNWLAFWSHEEIGVPISEGVSDVALALTVDAYARTYRSTAVSVASSASEVRTRGGLWIVPDRLTGGAQPPDRTLKPLDGTKPAAALDAALRDIAATHGRATSAFVALQMEYPQP
jgi:transcriptional regulator GlxA family with amidase domain